MRPFRILLRDTLVYGVLGVLTALFLLGLLILAHGCADREPLSSDECIELCGDICGGYCDPHLTTTTQDTATSTSSTSITHRPLGADEEEMLDGS